MSILTVRHVVPNEHRNRGIIEARKWILEERLRQTQRATNAGKKSEGAMTDGAENPGISVGKKAITRGARGILHFCSFFFLPSRHDWQQRYPRESAAWMQNHTRHDRVEPSPGSNRPRNYEIITRRSRDSSCESRVTRLATNIFAHASSSCN